MHRILYLIVTLVKWVASIFGLDDVLRTLVGPITGKILFRLSGKSGPDISVGGHIMTLSTKGKYPPIKLAMDEYEVETTALFLDQIKPGMNIADIGAHVGYYTLLAARLTGASGHVYSFEPDKDNYSLLQHNIQFNEYQNVTEVNLGISDVSGTKTLFISSLDNGRHSMYHQHTPESGSVLVSTITVDDFFERLGWPRIDFIKIDVEGSELDALNGMDGLLNRWPLVRMIIELNPRLLSRANVNPMHLLDRIISNGFTLHRVESDGSPIELQLLTLEEVCNKLMSSGSSINLFCVRLQ